MQVEVTVDGYRGLPRAVRIQAFHAAGSDATVRLASDSPTREVELALGSVTAEQLELWARHLLDVAAVVRHMRDEAGRRRRDVVASGQDLRSRLVDASLADGTRS
jgi:phage tail tube protein FII